MKINKLINKHWLLFRTPSRQKRAGGFWCSKGRTNGRKKPSHYGRQHKVQTSSDYKPTFSSLAARTNVPLVFLVSYRKSGTHIIQRQRVAAVVPCCCDFVQLCVAFITDLLLSQLGGFIKETVLCSFQKSG